MLKCLRFVVENGLQILMRFKGNPVRSEAECGRDLAQPGIDQEQQHGSGDGERTEPDQAQGKEHPLARSSGQGLSHAYPLARSPYDILKSRTLFCCQEFNYLI